MYTLTQGPFNLNVGSEIISRVRAINSVGDGEPSAPSNTNPMMPDLPTQTPSLQLIKINRPAKTLTFSWNSIISNQKLSSNQGFAYEVYWDSGTSGPFYKLTQTRTNQYTLYGYRNDMEYRFKVRSRFPCGAGPDSAELFIDRAGNTRTVRGTLNPISGSD